MNLSQMTYKKTLTEAVSVQLKNPYTDEDLIDDKGNRLVISIYSHKSDIFRNRVTEHQSSSNKNKDYSDGSYAIAHSIKSILGVIEGDFGKITNKDVGDADKLAEMLEELDFVAEQLSETFVDIHAFTAKK